MAPDGAASGVPASRPSETVRPAPTAPAGEGGLTRDQARAAAHDGPVLVLAGAGTGKTKTLTAATAWREAGQGIPASRLLVVTFTNRAADEMRGRIRTILGGRRAPSWLGTFHALAGRQLRYEPEVAGLRGGFAILDAVDAQRLVKRSMAALGLPVGSADGDAADRHSPKAVAKEIGKLKDALVPPELVAAHMATAAAAAERGGPPVDPVGADVVARVYVEYQRRLRETNAADFGDLVLWPTLAMQRDEAYRSRWSRRFDALLVDEYQDVNHGQYHWIMLLGCDHRKVFAVGDDDQSVYSFRGSNVEYIRNFTRDFPDARVVRLEENFRSTGHILAVANAVISCDQGRLGKTLYTNKGLGEKVEVVGFRGPDEEAAGIAAEMRRRNALGLPWGHMGLLFRGNAQARGYEEALLKARVPYRLVGDTGFYQREEIRDALALLRLAARPEDPQSDEAFRRVANVPARGLGSKTLGAIEAEAATKGCSLLIAARTAELPPKAREAALSFADAVLDAGADFGISLADQVSLLLDRTGYREMLRRSRADGAEGRLERLQELLLLAGSFHGADEFLEHTVLSGEGAEREGEGEGEVKLLTLHKGKGLEFPHVFLPAWEAGVFPAEYSSISEERRLAYVGLTRGRERVTVTYCAFRRGFTKPSLFIDDMPADHIVHGWLHGQGEAGGRPGQVGRAGRGGMARR